MVVKLYLTSILSLIKSFENFNPMYLLELLQFDRNYLIFFSTFLRKRELRYLSDNINLLYTNKG